MNGAFCVFLNNSAKATGKNLERKLKWSVFLHKLNMFQKCFLIITMTTVDETKILLTSSFQSF